MHTFWNIKIGEKIKKITNFLKPAGELTYIMN